SVAGRPRTISAVPNPTSSSIGLSSLDRINMASISPAELQYQEANIHDNRSAALYGVGIGMFVATTVAVVSRIMCKRSLKAKLTSDDYLIMLALVSHNHKAVKYR
ncbi:hypothetical protein MMC32_007756, partial [Xylographa parallela]|nr:hypothetical protein [Xylographa parallela]